MPKNASLYWWPRWSSCKKVKELLLQKGFEVKEVDYFRYPLSQDELVDLASPAGLSEIFAWRSPSIKKLDLQGRELTDHEMLQFMQQEPRLIRRPIIKIGNETIVGANIKAITEVLDNIPWRLLQGNGNLRSEITDWVNFELGSSHGNIRDDIIDLGHGNHVYKDSFF